MERGRGRGRGGRRPWGGGGHRGRGRGGPPDPGGHVHVQPGNGDAAPAQERMSHGQLKGLASDDGVKILQRLSNPNLLSLFTELTEEKQPDAGRMWLVVKVLAKLSSVEYQPLVVRLFCKVCKKDFLDQLLLHIVQLSLLCSSDGAQLASLADFYRDFCKLAHGIVKLVPTLACEKLHNMLRMAALELTQLPSFEGMEVISKELELVKAKLAVEKERLSVAARPEKRKPVRQFRFDDLDPPDDYRQLSVYPTADDIVDDVQPYLRRIIPRGRYRDANHYLDVLFRLLREDFVQPLRKGCAEYIQIKLAPANGGRPRHASNIRVYENVWFDKLLTADESVGLELVFDPDSKLTRVNWEYTRRLIKGALLLLSRDMDFSSVILASVSKRDLNQLAAGRVVVELCDSPVSEDLFEGTFLMVECVVFFGAYLHPLRALQALDEQSLPLKEYLVDACNARVLPAYLQQGVSLTLPAPGASIVLNDVTRLEDWPSAESLGLDESQYVALQGALTNKVMLVQGPPGTGKTFLGLQVAQTLLLNQYLWRSSMQPRPLLVLCSTNHALDQFLMGLLPFTQSLVRVGNPCREPLLEPYDIFQLRRKKIQGGYALFQMITAHKKRFVDLKQVHDSIRACLTLLRQDSGLVHPASLYSFGIITEAERDFFQNLPIQMWLLGPHNVPDSVFAQTIWDPNSLDLTCVEGEDLAALRRTVTYAVSRQVVEAAVVKFLEDDEMVPVVTLRRYWDDIRARLADPETQPPAMLVRAQDLAEMTALERWQQYRFWKNELLIEFGNLAEEISARYLIAAQQVQECRMVQDQTIMANHLVIGMSTSYAAMRHRILKELKPKIVIVEEAAEVLEATVLASLAVDVEHLVMIGDHQQLRPSTSVQDLANNYHLNVSMFERLVNNGVHCVTLTTQHRMRPQVAKLICPHIYPNLLNHESVNYFPDIRGVTKNVFFVDHQYPEEEPTYLKDAPSFQNPHEATFISALVRYFLLQGYEPSKITVLCTYKGQLYFLTKQLRPVESHLRDIRITTVDEYQGEENDIVLLSLVRSNLLSKLGYVGIENRACVALSRAKHGFFIIGNMKTLTSKESVWTAVDAELRRHAAVGPNLVLRCEVHGQLTAVATAEDFEQCPQGGCMRRCGVDLRCGHVCPQVCHPDDLQHVKYKCQENCMEVACPRGHPCRARCYEDCPPCAVPKQAMLACGHVVTMPCHRDPEEHKCQIEVDLVLPACGHSQRGKCCQRDSVAALPCQVPCKFRVDCGHSCVRKCHVLDDPLHEQYQCTKPCEDRREGCRANHKCRRLCHEDCEPCDVEVPKDLPCGHSRRMPCVDEPLAECCTQKCTRTMRCGHRCANKCRLPCGPCKVKVDKVLPRCGHSQPVPCSVDAALFADCSEPCRRSLACGHSCGLTCGAACSDAVCSQLVVYRGGLPACGHRIMVPCASTHDPSSPELLALCNEPCRKILECEHPCAGTCGKCLQGRFHVACKSKCERPLLCGHVCEAPCAASCPPCAKPCPVRCRHTKCQRTCGERCAPCKERCDMKCAHKRCPSLCSEPCPEDACSEPCTRVVKRCGHACVGLCGETCVCRECSDIEVFFGTEDDDDARFVVLPDCKHLFEVTSLDRWMLRAADEGSDKIAITKKVCPKCKTAVATSLRYGNVTKQNAADVAEIKERLFGTWTTIDPVAKETRELIEQIPERPPGCPALCDLVQTVNLHLGKVEKRARGRKRGGRGAPHLSLTGMQSLHQYVSVLSSLYKVANEARPHLRESKSSELEGVVELLCREIKRRDLVRLSVQEAKDINAELTRFHRLAALCKAESSGLLSSDAQAFLSRAIRIVGPYQMGRDGEVRQQLEKFSSIQEVLYVKAAMGLSSGHWFKCPNGHFYVITECGGAMQESVCNECKAPIGGTNHRLRSDNALARELGATAPAWPL